MRWTATLTFLLLVALASVFCTCWVLSSGRASSAGGLACNVRPSCNAGETAVFRMSSVSNAHAGTAGGSSYGNVVCCGGVAGLGTSCGGTHDTVLRLSATDNAHVQSTGAYSTEVCLSAGTAVVQCAFADSCATGYACLATASANDNAHVADCDGTNDYATKLCCYTGDPIPVGGVARLPDVSGSPGPNFMALAGGIAAALIALTMSALVVRRQRLR